MYTEEMDVELAVFSEADTGTSTARSDHATRVGQVRDTLLDDAIDTTLSDDANLKVFFVAFGEIEDGVDKNRAFVSTLRLEVICCGSDV